MAQARTTWLAAPAAVLLTAALGCAGMGLPGQRDAPPEPAERTVSGEVAWVDAQQRRIEIEERTGTVVARFDEGTRVIYQGREYRPENLDPGDRVRVEVRGTGTRDVYAERIEVLESVAEREPRDRRPSDRFEADVLAGEVQTLDPDRQEIRLETDRGEQRSVAYDRGTRVFYRGEEYRPENLERGDLIRIEVADLREREPYAERIVVTQAVQERREVPRTDQPAFEAERLTGTVEWIDGRRGEFGLQTERRGEVVTVEIPFDARDAVRDRFARLDRGQRVRIEAEPLGDGRVVLVRFL